MDRRLMGHAAQTAASPAPPEEANTALLPGGREAGKGTARRIAAGLPFARRPRHPDSEHHGHARHGIRVRPSSHVEPCCPYGSAPPQPPTGPAALRSTGTWRS